MLRSNVFNLYLVQFGNYVAPILAIPLLIKHVGLSGFGELNVVLALGGYFLILMDYSFSITATKAISEGRDDPKQIAQIVLAVICVKLSIWLFITIPTTFLIWSFAVFDAEKNTFLAMLAYVLFQSLMPTWYFQGIERTRSLAISSSMTKLLYLGSLFILLPIFPFAWVSILSLAVCTALSVVYNYYVFIKFTGASNLRLNLARIAEMLIGGKDIFMSNVLMSFYTNSVTVVLGLTSGNSNVGLYSAAEKVTQAARGLYAPLSQALFPYMTRLRQQDTSEFTKVSKLTVLLTAIVMGVISLVVFAMSDTIAKLVTDDKYLEVSSLIKILAPVCVFIPISNFLGLNIMVNQGRLIEFRNLIFKVALTALVLILPMCGLFDAYGAAVTVLGAETAVVAMLLFKVKSVLLS